MMDKGTLFLVATPIGNLEDMSARAIRTLREADLIAAEDTRQTLKLLNHFKISRPLTSYYEHNKGEKGGILLRQLLEGKNIALVSDAGSPGISDPGEELVRLCIDHEVPVTMIPGPVAAMTGLVVSGLPTGRFVFEGFLPVNKRARRERIASLKDEVRTVIFYEAPHKLIHTLRDLHEGLGDRKIALARELTKKFEEIRRCTLGEAIQCYENMAPKGEFVLILEGRNPGELLLEERRHWEEMTLAEHVDLYRKEGLDRKEAIKKVATDRGVSKREIYNELLNHEDE